VRRVGQPPQRGHRNLYALAPEGYAVAQRWFADTWTAALTAFARHLEQQK